jgi:hypothetical protein
VAGRTHAAVMAIWAGCEPCRQEAEVVRANLSEIGTTVEIEELSDPLAAARKPGADIDSARPVWGVGQMPIPLDASSMCTAGHASLLVAAGSSGAGRRRLATRWPRRWSAAVALADQLATKEVPVAATVTPVVPDLLGPRLGCRVYPPWGLGIDLAALCPGEAG